ncbi:UNVERIFIED_CONTAM: hypothetical protein HDU68_012032 [Siphonaria sp. JEL0065]|nr:hypothetical protein HDU68_012032 [Siphonaria sp. JEL0065]
MKNAILSTSITLLLQLLLASRIEIASAGSFSNSNGDVSITFAGKLVDSETVQICVEGMVEQNNYIGFGIPKAPGFPRMLGSDFYIFYTTPQNAQVEFMYGLGLGDEIEISYSSNVLSSSYERGVLKACFSRRVAGDKNSIVLDKPAG